LKIEFVMLKR